MLLPGRIDPQLLCPVVFASLESQGCDVSASLELIVATFPTGIEARSITGTKA
jgi:hypothetical protein